MRRLFVFLLIGCPGGFGQFSGLSTTYSGDRVYFASPLGQRGTDQPAYSKIFVARPGGGPVVSLVAMERPDPVFSYNKPYILTVPETNADGSVVSYLGASSGFFCYTCGTLISNAGTVVGADGWQGTFVGQRVHLSRLGRYLLLQPSNRDGAQFLPSDFVNYGPVSLYDRENQQVTVTFPADLDLKFSVFATTASGHVVSSNGVGVFSMRMRGEAQAALYVLTGDGARRMVEGVERGGVIDDGGSMVAYASGSSIVLHELNGDAERTIALPGFPEAFDFTGDGRKLMVSVRVEGRLELWLFETENGTGRKVGMGEEAVISGDGAVIYFTGGGKLSRLEVERGAVTTVLEAPPSIQGGRTYSVVPGSTYSLSGIPSAIRVEDISLTLNGNPVPVIYRSGTELLFQVPWKTPLGMNQSFHVLAPVTNEFEVQGPEMNVVNYNPEIVGVRPGTVHAGDYLEVYMNGLGAVTPEVEDEQPAPSSPLSVLTRTGVFLCILSFGLDDGGTALAPLFTGLAPTLIGVYQVNLQLPAVIAPGDYRIRCDGSGRVQVTVQ